MHAALLVLIADALFVPVGVLTSAFLTRTLAPEGYGIYSLSVSIGLWAEWSILAAFSRANIKLIGESHDWRPVAAAAWRVNLLVSSTVGAVLFALAPALATLLREPSILVPLRIYACSLPLTVSTSVHAQVLIGRGLFRARAWMSFSYALARAGFIIGLVWLGFGIEGAVLGLALSSLTSVTVARRFVRPGLARSGFPWRRLFEYALPMLVFSISQRLLGTMDLLMLKAAGRSTVEVGFYGAAQTVAMAANMGVMAMTPLLLSAVTRALRDGERTRAEFLVQTTFRLMLLALPLVAVIATCADQVLTLVSGERFLPAAPLIPPLSLAGLARGLMIAATTMLVAIGRPRLPSLLVAPSVPLALLLQALVIPHWGPPGAALVTLGVSSLIALAGVEAVRRCWGVMASGGTLLRSLAVSGLVFWLGDYHTAGTMAGALKLAWLAASVPLGFLVLGEFGRADWQLLRGLIAGAQRA